MSANDTQNDVQAVFVDALPIELHKLLKFENLVMSGGEAKQVIQNGLVRVNGEVELRRGRKLQLGDIVEFEGVSLRVEQLEDESEDF